MIEVRSRHLGDMFLLFVPFSFATSDRQTVQASFYDRYPVIDWLLISPNGWCSESAGLCRDGKDETRSSAKSIDLGQLAYLS